MPIMKLLCRYFPATPGRCESVEFSAWGRVASKADCERYQCKSVLNHVHCGSASTVTAEHFVNNGRQDQALAPSVVPQYQLLVICSCRTPRTGGSTALPPFLRQ